MIIYAFPAQGWYLISLPIFVADSSVATLFPSAIGAFSFDSENYEYYLVDTLQTGKGFWLAVNEPFFAVVSGTLLNEFTIHYEQGWHLLGSVTDSVNFSDPNDNPDNSVLLPLFCWDDVGQEYYATNTLQQAYGHWVAVYQECDITVSNSVTPNLFKQVTQAQKQEFYQKYGSSPPPPPYELQPELKHLLPVRKELSYNYPNPFNAGTTINYSLSQAGKVSICVFNIMGQNIRTLFSGELFPGEHRVSWDGKDDFGEQVASGVYLYKIIAPSLFESGKMILLQ